MSLKGRLHVVEPSAPLEPRTAPTQFNREVTTPVGPPWRQRRVAELEARLGAPISSEGLTYRIARLEPWNLGRPGRFVVTYSRSGLAGPTGQARGFTATAFGGAAFEDVRTRLLVAVGVALVSLTLFGVAVSSALSRRADISSDLASLDDALRPAEHRAAQLAQLDRQTTALNSAGGEARSVAHVLSDLDWLAAHKRPDVPVTAVHWLHGVSAIEAASAATPFLDADRRAQRASRPLRPGVWLWGVVDAQAAGQ